MARELVTRRVLARQLALNAATRPLNVAVPCAVVVGALLLHTPWLLPLAFATYVAMLVATFFDGDEAARVGRETYARARRPRARLDPWQFAPPIARKLELANAEEQRIAEASDDAVLVGEVAQLMEALDDLALRAQRVHDFLDGQDEAAIRRRLSGLGDDAAERRAAAALAEQLRVREQLLDQLARFDAEMEHIAASLGAVHGQIVRFAVTAGSAGGGVTAQVRHLRDGVTAAADALGEAYREVDADESDS